jgi:hypothetical protein
VDAERIIGAIVNWAKEQPHRLGEVLRLWLVEVEHDGQIAAIAKFLAQSFQHHNPALGEAAEQRHSLVADRVDHSADFLVVKKEVDELGDLKVIDYDRWLAFGSNDQALLLGSFAKSLTQKLLALGVRA